MFEKKTLIVVGAGASKEGNLPASYELKERIAEILDIRFEFGKGQVSGDYVTCEAIRKFSESNDPNGRNINQYWETARRIRDAMPQAISIDNFIDAHKGDSKLELCGKLAIIRSILKAESNSLLYFGRKGRSENLDYQSLDGTWFNAFMQLLTENCRVDQLEERLSAIGLIIFNYDRCIEHFLFHSLQNYYGISSERAAALVCGIEIYHPYGTVGALPWYQGDSAIEFGAEPKVGQLLDLAGQIKTFTEGTDPDSSDIVEIRKRMNESQIILFLGFAFHRVNLGLIRPTENKHSTPEEVRYFGTALGISQIDCDTISTELVELGGAKRENIALRNDLTCSQLFREFWRSLSLS
jgi:hypothetical protein